VQLPGRTFSPFEFIQISAKIDVIIDSGLAEFIQHVVSEIDKCNPAVFGFLKPFLVVAVVAGMKIQYVFPYQYKLLNALIAQHFNHFPLQHHDIVVQGIIPLANQFQNGVTIYVINV